MEHLFSNSRNSTASILIQTCSVYSHCKPVTFKHRQKPIKTECVSNRSSSWGDSQVEGEKTTRFRWFRPTFGSPLSPSSTQSTEIIFLSVMQICVSGFTFSRRLKEHEQPTVSIRQANKQACWRVQGQQQNYLLWLMLCVGWRTHPEVVRKKANEWLCRELCINF